MNAACGATLASGVHVAVDRPDRLLGGGRRVTFAGIVVGFSRDKVGDVVEVRTWTDGAWGDVRLARPDQCRVAKPAPSLRRELAQNDHVASVIKHREESLEKARRREQAKTAREARRARARRTT